MEGALPWIAENMSIIASLEWNSNQTMYSRADLAYRFELRVNDIGGHSIALEEIAIEPAKIAIDVFAFLNLLDAIDGGRLAFIEDL